MKIAIITPFDKHVGGVETVNSLLKDIFERNNHHVTIIDSQNYKLNLWDKIGVKFFGLPHITSKKFKRSKQLYDLVISNGEFGFGINHKNAINLFHGSYIGYRDYLKDNLTFKKFLVYTWLAYIQKLAARNKECIAVSDFVKQILEKQGITINKVIKNSVDTEVFKPMTLEKKNCLFVGTNLYAKGIDVLNSIAEAGVQINCACDSNPGGDLHWLGRIDNAELPKVYNNHEILLFPSRFEAMPMVPLEAMACGIPVVMSNVGLGPELRKAIPEFVVDGWDEKSVSTYLERIDALTSNYKDFSEKARNYVVSNHSFSEFEKSWLETISKYEKQLN